MLHNMSPSSALNTSTTSPTNLFIQSSSTSTTKQCNDMLCRKYCGSQHKCYLLNTAACSPADDSYINAWKTTTVDIVTKRTVQKPYIQCFVEFRIDRAQYVNVSIDQGKAGNEGNANFTLKLFNSAYQHIFNDTILKKNSVTVLFTREFSLVLISHAPHRTSIIRILCVVIKGFLFRALPVVHLSDSIGYVTSPRQNSNQKTYQWDYDGVFHLNLSGNESVFISFSHFVLRESSNCRENYVTLKSTVGETWTKCGRQNLPLQIFRSSVQLRFHSYKVTHKILHTAPDDVRTGFKMMFAILPRTQEPQQLSVNLLNCSVPHFHMFQPLLNCNLERECQDGEDEQDCDYYSDDCQQGDIDAGTKCYKLFRQTHMTWTNAGHDCSRHGHSLAMLAAVYEYRRFANIVSAMRNVHFVYIGARFVNRFRTVTSAFKGYYKYVGQWIDRRTAFILNYANARQYSCAAYLSGLKALPLPIRCDKDYQADFFCEYEKVNVATLDKTINDSTQMSSSTISKELIWNVSVVQCAAGYMTRHFLSCDSQERCRANDLKTSCQMRDAPVPMFMCVMTKTPLHYTLVCDFINHCYAKFDETFCYHPPCPATQQKCQNGQCIPRNQFCDGMKNCFDGSDEGRKCDIITDFYLSESALPPAILYTDDRDRPRLRKMSDSEKCPITHFQCPGGYCLPIFLLCNGILDCPGREDEAECDSYVCPGLYRCQGSKVCLHPDNVCDGVFHCPKFDDEIVCEESICPDVCHCQGLAFLCTASFSASSYTKLRYLDASGTGMTPDDLIHNLYLIHLRLSKCRIKALPTLRLPNLIQMDLSWNDLQFIDIQQFRLLQKLKELILSGNPLSKFTSGVPPYTDMKKIRKIDISHTDIIVYNGSALASCYNLKILNISESKTTTITKEGFQSTVILEILDVRGSPLQNFPNNLLRNLTSLKHVYTDNYVLCCKVMLPDTFLLKNCHAEDLLASCEDLLKSNAYRVSLWVFTLLSLLGNLGSFAGRLYLQTGSSSLSSFGVLVANLTVADFLMGVYLAVIGVADLVFHEEYLWYNVHWKNSVACNMAGLLSVTSSEVSAFLICLITLDRFLVLRFPFSTVHFTRQSALVACGIVWIMGVVIAIIPLLPVTLFWKYYGQTSICIPLPFINEKNFFGYTYSFTVMIILNFILFVLIAVGQAIIYFSIRSNSMKMTASKDATIVQRLTTVALSDFLCWFPVGLLGVLASTGTAVPGELSVAVVIFVLPLNSALNPFLYTFNVFMEKRRKAQEVALMKRLGSRVNAL